MNYKPGKTGKNKIDWVSIKAFIKSLVVIGIFRRGRLEYWKFLAWTLLKKPQLFIDAITLAVYGHHFRTVFGLQKS